MNLPVKPLRIALALLRSVLGKKDVEDTPTPPARAGALCTPASLDSSNLAGQTPRNIEQGTRSARFEALFPVPVSLFLCTGFLCTGGA